MQDVAAPETAPVTDIALPAAQAAFLQVNWPAVSWYRPASHAMHAIPAAGAYLPSAQALMGPVVPPVLPPVVPPVLVEQAVVAAVPTAHVPGPVG